MSVMNTESYQSQTDEELVALSQQDQFAFHALLARYEKVVSFAANAQACSYADAEDYAEEGLLGLISAVSAYSAERHASFRTFATVCIQNRIRTARARAPREKGLSDGFVRLSMDDLDVSDADALTDRSVSPEFAFLQKERVSELYEKMSQVLSRQELESFCLYLNGFSYTEIAERSNISEKSVDNAIQRARRKLRAVWSLPASQK